MDSLTQIVLGAAVGNAVAGKKLKNKALLYGAIAGTIPDLDVVVGWFLDPILALQIHRGLSHSILFAVAMSLLLGWLVTLVERKRQLTFKEGFTLFFAGLVTHSLLDIFTTWGTRILWPYSHPFAFKSIFVIDPLYTLPFLICLLISMVETKDLKRRMKWNTRALYLSSAYLVLTLLLKFAAHQKFQAALQNQQLSYSGLSVKPSALNTILWNAIVETEDSYWIGDYSFLDHSPIEFKSFPKNHHRISSIANEPVVLQLIDLSEGWYAISEKGGRLYFNDLRFGLLKSDASDWQFAFSYHLFQDHNGAWQAEEVAKKREDGLLLLKKLWFRLQGR